MTDWALLTRISAKAEYYSSEPYFRESLDDLHQVVEDPADVLQHGAMLMVKPDGQAAGKIESTIRYVDEHGFDPVGVYRPTLGPVWRQLWRYQLTCATLDRLAVNELLMDATGLLILLRERPEAASSVPAMVRLSTLKGPADVTAQPPDCLRKLLAQPNRVLSYVHLPDEPADLVRELGVFLPTETRRPAWQQLSGDGPVMQARVLAEAVADERSGRTVHDLSVARALDRLEVLIKNHDAEAIPELMEPLRRMQADAKISWRPFVEALTAQGIAPDRWDLIVLGTTFIVYDDLGRSKQLVNVPVSEWQGAPTVVGAASELYSRPQLSPLR